MGHRPIDDAPSRPRVWQHVLRVPLVERRLIARLRLLGLDPHLSDTVQGAHVIETVGDGASDEICRLVERYAPHADLVRLPCLPPSLDGPATAPLDLDPDDEPQRCVWCSRWSARRCLDHRGELMLREWHHPHCPRITDSGDETLS